MSRIIRLQDGLVRTAGRHAVVRERAVLVLASASGVELVANLLPILFQALSLGLLPSRRTELQDLIFDGG
jgi:hypothetical protein